MSDDNQDSTSVGGTSNVIDENTFVVNGSVYGDSNDLNEVIQDTSLDVNDVVGGDCNNKDEGVEESTLNIDENVEDKIDPSTSLEKVDYVNRISKLSDRMLYLHKDYRSMLFVMSFCVYNDWQNLFMETCERLVSIRRKKFKNNVNNRLLKLYKLLNNAQSDYFKTVGIKSNDEKLNEQDVSTIVHDRSYIRNLWRRYRVEVYLKALLIIFLLKLPSICYLLTSIIYLLYCLGAVDVLIFTVHYIRTHPIIQRIVPIWNTIRDYIEPLLLIPPSTENATRRREQTTQDDDLSIHNESPSRNQTVSRHEDGYSLEIHPAVSYSNSLPVNGNATPGDRGEGSDESSIMGMMEDGAKDVFDVTSSGMKSSTGHRVEPVADLREAEGEVNRKLHAMGNKAVTSSGNENKERTLDDKGDIIEEEEKRDIGIEYSSRLPPNVVTLEGLDVHVEDIVDSSHQSSGNLTPTNAIVNQITSPTAPSYMERVVYQTVVSFILSLLPWWEPNQNYLRV